MQLPDFIKYAQLKLIQVVDPGILKRLLEDANSLHFYSTPAAALGHPHQGLHEQVGVLQQQAPLPRLIVIEEGLMNAIG